MLITGFGGFIGYTLVQSLKDKVGVVALDNFSQLSNFDIKLARAAQLGIDDFENFKAQGSATISNTSFYYTDLCDTARLQEIFTKHKIDLVIHLAALTGVRQSLVSPMPYIDSNIKGFVNLIECAVKAGVRNIIYASSSSVYGLNTSTPYTEDLRTDSPISIYAASKKADELLANVYAHLYNINMVGLRFFTVYGPWTRPDMAAYIFMKAIKDKKPIDLFNEGKMVRDFTYVGDIVKAISVLIKQMPERDFKNEVFNIGNHNPILTIDFLHALEQAMGVKAEIANKPMQPGDMPATNASVDKLFTETGFKPTTSLHEGVKEMVKWFEGYYAPVKR